MKLRTFFITILMATNLAVPAQTLNVIPQPQKVDWGRGSYSGKTVTTSVNARLPHADEYTIDITQRGVTIKAQSNAGLQYAEETLAQLRSQYGKQLPCMSITDWPQYEWRGLMLDCSRHFYTLEYLKKQVDILAHYKMNRLHLHLTDDQGWRLEIKQYPELTQQGAWREFNQQDSICLSDFKDQPEFQLDPRFIIHHQGKTLYGGFYTQEQMKNLVEYAAERNVEIIPEIDMPGHTQAISAIHPEFTATGVAQWGTVFSVPLSPTKEEVYQYLENILDEVMAVFPSHYIHIGADEVEKNTWKESEACRLLMEREGIKTYEALQSYFVEKIHKYVQSKGREIICWDDAMEGGLSKDANVMYWRYWVAGVPEKAIAEGHKVIFTPGSPMYVAHADGPLYNVYNYDGLDKVPADKQHLVRGGQVSLWGENMSNFRRADYCIYPRLVALSELLWTSKNQRSWKSFKKRLDVEKNWLTAHDVKFAKTVSVLTAMQKTEQEKQQLSVTFDSEFADPDIRYTLDGTTPTASSKKYNDTPILIKKGDKPVDMVAAIMASANGQNADGKAQEPLFRRHLDYHKAVGAKVDYLKGRWHESYKSAELATLTDGKRGDEQNFGDGLWQGFDCSFEVLVDLGAETDINDITIRFIQNAGPGVLMPGTVDIAIGNTPETLTALRDEPQANKPSETLLNDIPATEKKVVVKDFSQKYPAGTRARYIKVNGNNTQGGFIFADEIVVH